MPCLSSNLDCFSRVRLDGTVLIPLTLGVEIAAVEFIVSYDHVRIWGYERVGPAFDASPRRFNPHLRTWFMSGPTFLSVDVDTVSP